MSINWITAQPLVGGMSLGFEEAFDCPPKAIITTHACKNDKHYVHYMNNIRKLDIPLIYMNDTYTQCEDEASKNNLKNILKEGIDVFQSVPVCAGLSLLNCVTSTESSKKRGAADNDQNQNMYQLNTLGMKLRAKVVVFENAPAAYTNSGKATIDHLKSISDSFKYGVHLLKTDTLYHGIPQSRIRTFITFFKDGVCPEFKYEHLTTKTIVDYLKGVPKNSLYNDVSVGVAKDVFYECINGIYSHLGNNFYERMMKLKGKKKSATAIYVIQMNNDFDRAIQWMKDKIEESCGNKQYVSGHRVLKHCKNKTDMGKGYWDSSAYISNSGKYINAVISKNMHRIIHPTEDRGLTVRELMWLMGMPHDFEFIDDKSYYQLSQNVPVTTAKYIATQILNYFNNKLLLTNESFVKQDNTKQRRDV